MLFNNLTTERRASLIVKNSRFYIEIAKFVQAYTTIVKNPNEFLEEVNEQSIDAKKETLTWEQLKKIMQSCDFGFINIPSDMDLVIYYNYALAMGSVTALEKRIASVDQVAEAQKHYYNFVDEEKTSVQEEYIKQKKVYEARVREMSYVDGQIAVSKAKNVFYAIMMFLSVAIGLLGVVSFFVENIIATSLGKIIPVWKSHYIGGIILIVIMLLLFALFNSLYNKANFDLKSLKQANSTIFEKEIQLAEKQQLLKNRLNDVNKTYNAVLKEINDKRKRYDVKHNIDVLKTTNKYYKLFCETEELDKFAENIVTNQKRNDDDFAPIKLSKEQEENLHDVKTAVIGLAGQIDKNAYNEKFEKSSKKKNIDEKIENDNNEEKELKENLDRQKREQERKGFIDSLDYAKDLLGMNSGNKENEK